MIPKLAIVAIILIVVAVILALGYVKAPPDTAYIISGIKPEPRVLIGKAGVRIPFFERLDKLLVRQISIDIKTNGFVPTLDFIGVDIDAVAKIRVKTESENGDKNSGIQKAMRNFLNMDEKQIIAALTDSLQGNMREIIGTVSLKELCTDRKKFGDEIQSKAQQDMSALGIEIISCNIQKITDERDLITALGQDNMSQIQKDASIAKAQADRDVKIAEAQAKREANDAEVAAQTEIAQKQNELSIKKAELQVQADTKKAIADAAYKIQQQEQQKTIEAATVNAQIAKAEREAELRSKEVEVRKNALDADIRAQADAERYRQEQEAQADLFRRQKDAEAKKYEQEQAAEGIRAVGKAEADAIRAKTLAEAEGIRAKAVAEAEGIDKKAEAMKKYGEAAIIEMVMTALPEVARNISEPLSKVDHITMYGEGNSTKLISDIVNSTTQVTEGISKSLGVDVRSLLAGAIGGKVAGLTNNTQATTASVSTPVVADTDASAEDAVSVDGNS